MIEISDENYLRVQVTEKCACQNIGTAAMTVFIHVCLDVLNTFLNKLCESQLKQQTIAINLQNMIQ